MKFVKQSKIIIQQTKTAKNPNIDIKSVTIEHPETLKLSRAG